MTDRESIVAYLRLQAKSASGGDSNDTVERVAHAATAAACQSLADQIERGVDLIPVKPRATIADLLALHDLDLGALAHAAGIIGDDLDDGDVKALCDKHSSVNDWHELVADIIPSTAATWDARQLAALGAKVRAALSAPTLGAGVKPSTGKHALAPGVEVRTSGYAVVPSGSSSPNRQWTSVAAPQPPLP